MKWHDSYTNAVIGLGSIWMIITIVGILTSVNNLLTFMWIWAFMKMKYVHGMIGLKNKK